MYDTPVLLPAATGRRHLISSWLSSTPSIHARKAKLLESAGHKKAFVLADTAVKLRCA